MTAKHAKLKAGRPTTKRGSAVRRQKRRGTGGLAPRTVNHSYRIFKTMLTDAVAEGLLPANPATLRVHRGEVPRIKDKDPLWRRNAVYTPGEVRILTTDARLVQRRRVAYTLEALAGLRFGEASALRCRSWSRAEKPLSRLDSFEAYDSNNRRRRGHLIVPAEGLRFRHKNDGWTEQNEDLQTLGLRHRRQHDFRRTFISLARDDGARGDMLKWITHGPQRNDILDEYTTPVWKTLCDQVLCVKLGDEPKTEEKGSEIMLLEAKTEQQTDPQLLQQLLQSIAFLNDFKEINGWGTRIRT